MEDLVKAIEAKESAKQAKGKLGVETKACFSCRGNTHNLTREGFLKCPALMQLSQEVQNPKK